MCWDCSIIFETASKMLEILRSPHLTKRATCAEKKQHGRRRVSCERVVPPRRHPARFAVRCPRLSLRSARMATVSSEMRVASCVEPRRSQTIGSGPREVRGAQERASDSFTILTVSRRVREKSKGGSHPHATPTLCRRSGQILCCSVLCHSSADLLVGTTSPDHRMRNGAKSGKARSGEIWSWQIW